MRLQTPPAVCSLVVQCLSMWLLNAALVMAQDTSKNAEPPARPDFDVLITGGRIVDGSGAPWYRGDVGIRDGKITAIGHLSERSAAESIDATGLTVAPGFVDMMGQSATPMMNDPKTARNLLTQGITTINAGEGASAAPLGDDDGRRQGWTTMAEYFTLLELQGLPVNVTQTIGHTQVRRIVIGDVERRPSAEELARMQDMIREAMEAGAIGVSTALIYPPAVFADTEEIAALADVAGRFGGRYFTHMRNEGDQLLEAIDEALEIGRRGRTPVHIFHLKTAGQQNWGKMPLAIARIKAARAAGEQVTADIYPYINNGLGIAALIHPKHFSEGYDRLRNRIDDAALRAEIRKEMETTSGWENWFRHCGHDWNRVIVGRTDDRRYSDLPGQSIQAIAAAKQEDPWDTFFALVKTGAFVLPQSMTEANKILAMQQEFVSFCTDVGPAGGDSFASHPRAYGAFPRLFAKYVRELGAISLERAVAQASAAGANNLLAYDRGRISIGLAADVIVFDFTQLTDRATFSEPAALSQGMKHVFVNGKLVLKDGEFTGALPGRVLRGPGYRRDKAPFAVRTGSQDHRLNDFDRKMSEFMEHHRIPGAAIAVTKEGRLVMARGYGYADIAKRELVQPTSLFRVASISKPITAVAVLQLVEQKKLTLDDKVLKILDYESDITAAGDKFDGRWRDITIRQLLEHRGGWDRDKSFDPMFQSVRFARETGTEPPANQAAVIRAMLSVKLDFTPGDRYAYSNFGYCLLGRVIEKLTGEGYEDFVKSSVLKPIGITAMRIGATRLEGRAANEVRYYQPGTGKSVFASDLGQDVPWPYGGWNLEAMDSHGAWIASAVDLARFASAFDFPDKSPLLTRASIELMDSKPVGLTEPGDATDPKAYYSLGWQNRERPDGSVDHWHTGSLNGTATLLIRRRDGLNTVGLLNARVSPHSQRLTRDLDKLLHDAATGVRDWPEIDLFGPRTTN